MQNVEREPTETTEVIIRSYPSMPRTQRVPESPENAPEARLIVRYLTPLLSFIHPTQYAFISRTITPLIATY